MENVFRASLEKMGRLTCALLGGANRPISPVGVVMGVSIWVVSIRASCAIVEVGAVFVMILVKNVPLAIVFVVEAISSDYSTYATYRLSDLCPRRWRLVYLEQY